MPDQAQINRSLSAIKSGAYQAAARREIESAELEYLRDAGVLQQYQFDDIIRQLPNRDGQQPNYNDQHSGYDTKAPPMYQNNYAGQQNQYQHQYPQQQFDYQQQFSNPPQTYAPIASPQTLQQAQQEPAAAPNHPKHNEWVKKVGSKFGNAAIFGAGATLGSDVMNSIWQKF